MVSLPNLSTVNYTQFKGTTNQLGPGGVKADYQQFTLSKSGEFNFKIANSYTTVDIVNRRNEVVATARSTYDAAQAHARLEPGTYTAVIKQQFRGVNDRDYDLQVTPRANPLVTAGGGALVGTARPLSGQDTGVQKHGLNVVQGGEFAVNFSLPNTRWSILNKEGKLVASGDTMSAERGQLDILNKQGIKLEPGQYEVVTVLPSKLEQETQFRMDLIPRVAGISGSTTTEERPIDKILREREARLAQWAAEEASGTTSSA